MSCSILAFLRLRKIKSIEIFIAFFFSILVINSLIKKSNFLVFFNLNFLSDIDLTVSTDFEDLAIIASDVFEVIEHDRILLMDGVIDLFIINGFSLVKPSTFTSVR